VIFGDYNSKCASGTATKDQMTACIGALDCLNNGGSFNERICSPGGPDNCHNRLLVNDALGLTSSRRDRRGARTPAQIFWEGTGAFHNVNTNKGKNIPLPIFGACGANQPKSHSNKSGGTLHFYKARVGDFGEPADIFQKPAEVLFGMP
jgi:hypothetical protein